MKMSFIIHLFAIFMCMGLCVYAQDEPLGDPMNIAGRVSSTESASWFARPPATPGRVLFGHPNDHQLGRDGSESKPYGLHDLNEEGLVKPGDVVWLTTGEYVGNFEFSRNAGTKAAPIIIRAVPGHRVTIVGKVSLTAAHTWLWGIEITDKYDSQPVLSAVRMEADGVKLIHCFIHDIGHGSAVFAPAGYADQLVYGTVLMRAGLDKRADQLEQPPHLVHAGNSFAETGPKFFVNNIFLDQGLVCDQCTNFYGFSAPQATQEAWAEGRANGFHLFKNVFSNGMVRVGGDGPPADHMVLDGNVLFDSELMIGEDSPTQAVVRSNFLGWSAMNTRNVWGAGETAYTGAEAPAASQYTDNTILNPWKDGTAEADRFVLRVSTARYESGLPVPSIVEKEPQLDPSRTVFARNTYGPDNALFQLDAGGVLLQAVDFITFRNRSHEAGAALDQDSQVDSSTTADGTTPTAFAWRSAYDDQWGILAVFNWGDQTKLQVSMADLRLSTGDRVELVDPANPFAEEPALVGVYNRQKFPVDFTKFDLRPPTESTTDQTKLQFNKIVDDISDDARTSTSNRFAVWLVRINYAQSSSTSNNPDNGNGVQNTSPNALMSVAAGRQPLATLVVILIALFVCF